MTTLRVGYLVSLTFGVALLSMAQGDRIHAADTQSKDDAAKADHKPADLPLNKVVMFNSGVGFFEHHGDVQGDASIDLKFKVDDVNDLLKSMVLQDMGGGRISAVNYGSRDPITKTLKTFSIDLTTNPTLGQILDQARGERVEVDTANAITGTLLGVERRKKEVGKDPQVIEQEYLNILTDAGLRSIALDGVSRIRFLDDKLDAELRQALKVLALGHSTDKKTVTLNFLGQGKRPVRVGYIQQTPVWKTSYRLVLKDDEAPFLQGWAIVENTTEEDWNKVNLTLISGRPISFIMDLYQPLYVQRPVVEPELFASLRPQTYGQDLSRAEDEFRRLGRPTTPAPTAAAPGPPRKPAGKAFANGGELLKQVELSDKAGEAGINLQQGGQSMAQAADVGELFQYAIAAPVTLSRQQSAMLPIVNESVKGEKVSIYNQAVQVKHPLNGLRLTNSTDLHLMQGPITVFDAGTYAGDARIEDLQPGTERLISYALDLDTEVAPEAQAHLEQLLAVRLAKGVMFTTRKFTRANKYTIKNSSKKAKKVLVEYPLDANWKLVEPKEPGEKTRDKYRFAVAAEPGKPATLNVAEEQTVSQQVAINNLDDNTIRFYLEQKIVSDKVKAALQEVVKRKQQLLDVVQERQRQEQQITVINQEQERIRQNMAQLERTSDLYLRYLKKFSEQEDQVEKLRGQIQQQTDSETKLRKSLDDYLLGLDVE